MPYVGLHNFSEKSSISARQLIVTITEIIPQFDIWNIKVYQINNRLNWWGDIISKLHLKSTKMLPQVLNTASLSIDQHHPTSCLKHHFLRKSKTSQVCHGESLPDNNDCFISSKIGFLDLWRGRNFYYWHNVYHSSKTFSELNRFVSELQKRKCKKGFMKLICVGICKKNLKSGTYLQFSDRGLVLIQVRLSYYYRVRGREKLTGPYNSKIMHERRNISEKWYGCETISRTEVLSLAKQFNHLLQATSQMHVQKVKESEIRLNFNTNSQYPAQQRSDSNTTLLEILENISINHWNIIDGIGVTAL